MIGVFRFVLKSMEWYGGRGGVEAGGSGSEVEEGLGREDGGRRRGKETGRKGRGDGEGKGAGGLVMFIKQKIVPGAPGEGEDRVRKGTRGALPSVLEPLEGPSEVHWPPRNAQK